MNTNRHSVGLLIGIACISILAGSLTAKESERETSPATPSVADTVESIVQAQETVRGQIADLEAAPTRAGSPQANQTGQRIEQLDLLKYRAAILAQRRAVAEQSEELEAQHSETAEQLQLLRSAGMATPPPYSLLTLEDLLEQADAEADRHASIEAEIGATRELLSMMRKTHAERERQRRAAKDALGRNHDPAAAATLERALQRAQLISEVAQETVRLHAARLAAGQWELKCSDLRRTLLDEQVQVVASQVTFTPSDLKSIQQDLDHQEQQLKEQIAHKQTELQQAQQNWSEAKSRENEPPAEPGAAEALTAWRMARDCRQKQIAALNQRVGELGLLRYCWDARFAVRNRTTSVEEMRAMRDEIAAFSERLAQTRELAQLDFDQCRRDLAATEARLRDARSKSPALIPWLQFEVDTLQQLAASDSNALLRVDEFANLIGRMTAELNEAIGDQTPRPVLASTRAWLVTAWNYELASVDDHPITVRKLAGTLLFLLVGFFVSRWASRMLGRRVLPRFGLAEGNAAALQSIGFYLLFLLFAYCSLELIGVPLTVFAFLGGAVAIGVGFGSQNILNNFISGLILLFERPIRVGDLVDVDGVYGNIERVGARSTRIRTGANLEIIVPNSRLLENNVTNLTLSDERFRACVSVGVAYGSPTRQVAEILQQVVHEHPDVFNEPEPIILFKEFGDNSLAFEVHFWIRMRTLMQRQRIESAVRHLIDDRFREANITIAFPQRDIHLDTSAPLELLLRNAEDADQSVAGRIEPAA